ncbi:MBL fold metallo-hydrolase [Selenihalanaerobacter shriftii]|uniref:beta-lactamase n=1 Tax=Selenihalanaerobacter shriftii TaxID=142842 RepID=A0A1T4JQ78_9FIRM|nr:MBL fold metallo-hydrolase [Selenihalanaerobacter shriftii]SJZ32392.1 Glyoxylase, beta-lactamase superfamily II [Selenihalanaerobacter shriftii]
MELKQVKERVNYIASPTNLGVIEADTGVVLIDSGVDDSVGKRVLKILEKEGFEVQAIINTHSHADHCGGNAYIKEETGVEIYAPQIEAGIIQAPYLEPLYLFSGASPIEELKNKFLMAKPSQVDNILDGDKERLTIGNTNLKSIPLSGHSPNQIGIEIEDVLFCADSIFSKAVLRKHKIPFYTDIDSQKETLSFLKNSDYESYIPSHGKPIDNIDELVEANLEVIEEVEEYILEVLVDKQTTENILKELVTHLKIKLERNQQYFLMKTATMAYLSSLYNRDKLESSIENNLLLWKRK